MTHWSPSLDADYGWFIMDKNIDLSKFSPEEVFNRSLKIYKIFRSYETQLITGIIKLPAAGTI